MADELTPEEKKAKARERKRQSSKELLAKHPERQPAYGKKYRENHADVLRARRVALAASLSPEAKAAKREADRVRQARKRKADPEKAKAISRESYRLHKEERAAEKRDWRKAHPEKALAISRASSAKRRKMYPDAGKAYYAANAERERERARIRARAHKEQQNARSRAWRQQNPERKKELGRAWSAANRERLNAQTRERWQGDRSMLRLVRQAAGRAKKNCLEFDGLTDIVHSTQTHCLCCGLPFHYSKDDNARCRNMLPSLDRLDNTKGYTADNVRIICWRCNKLKGQANIEELETILAYMKAHAARAT